MTKSTNRKVQCASCGEQYFAKRPHTCDPRKLKGGRNQSEPQKMRFEEDVLRQGRESAVTKPIASSSSKPPEFEIGQKVPLEPPKLDIRPAFTGAGKPSFKAARHGKRPPGQ